MTRPLRLYRFQRRAGRLNFGDDMAAALLEAAAGRPVECVAPAMAEVVGLGSILHRFTSRYAAGRLRLLRALRLRTDLPAIWGSGFAKRPDPLDPRAIRPLLLRGPLTARLLGVSDVPFGDPGLLVAEVFAGATAKTHAVGVVPHYADKAAPSVAALLDRIPGAHLIDVEAPFGTVLRQISACDLIVSSSLHGLISADSYGIPSIRARFTPSSAVGDLKFEDYAVSVGREDFRATDSRELDARSLASPPPPVPAARIAAMCAALVKAAKAL